MTNPTDPTPPQQPSADHVAFVQAVVALARKHRMNNVKVEFRTSVSAWWGEAVRPYTGVVTGVWSEGRHGDHGRIGLTFEGGITVEELPPAKTEGLNP